MSIQYDVKIKFETVDVGSELHATECISHDIVELATNRLQND